MCERRRIAQEGGIQIAAPNACRHIARVHRHSFLQEELLNVAALLRADLHAPRLDRPSEEMRALLLRRVFTPSKCAEQCEGDQNEHDPHRLCLHAASPFSPNRNIAYRNR